MRVLITNDDGIQATGLHALRGELREIRISMSSSPPTRIGARRRAQHHHALPALGRGAPFDDGSVGYATDGTPVDCVRFAELGLVGERPELIVSGINHGSNLGDDITYSGTVAAALGRIVLGIPAIAISQRSAAREMDFAGAASSTSRSRPPSPRRSSGGSPRIRCPPTPS